MLLDIFCVVGSVLAILWWYKNSKGYETLYMYGNRSQQIKTINTTTKELLPIWDDSWIHFSTYLYEVRTISN